MKKIKISFSVIVERDMNEIYMRSLMSSLRDVVNRSNIKHESAGYSVEEVNNNVGKQRARRNKEKVK